MDPESRTLRSATVAYLFPVQPRVERKQAMQFFDQLRDSHVAVSQYSEQPTGVAISSAIGGGSGQQVFQVTVDHHGPNLRLFFEENFPTRPLSLFIEDANVVWEAFNRAWPPATVGTSIMTEVKIRLTFSAVGGNATEYLANRVFHLQSDAISKLGRPPQGLGLRIALPLAVVREPATAPLSGASGNLLIETLMEDATRLYAELTATWPTIPLPAGILIEGSSLLNAAPKPPGNRVQEVYDYMGSQLVDFLSTATSD